MIVRYTYQGWNIVMQRSHGLLAAQICGHWKKDNQPKRWVETLIATAEHDDGKSEFDRSPLIHKNGGPVNFKMNPFNVNYCDDLLERALTKGKYIGIQISMHIRFLYGEEPKARNYCDSLLKKEKSWIRETKTTLKEASASYELLEFCDAFSLLICQGLVQPENRKMEISEGPDGVSYQLSLADDGRLIVEPWPFENSAFMVNYESRCVPELAFSSDADFKSKLLAAPTTLHTLILARK